MNQFKFSCPRCEQHLQCDEQESGRELQCPNCHHLIRVPPIPGRTAEYNPEFGKTWATFVASGNVPPPKGISLASRTGQCRPERSQPKEALPKNFRFYMKQFGRKRRLHL
jgi:DNA-directed RNA polymerase subunit RPC12/RpoP